MAFVAAVPAAPPASAAARVRQTVEFAYVANFGSDTVSVIDTATNTVIRTVAVGDGPWGVAFSPDGTRAYVTNSGSATVSVIETVAHTVVGTIALPAGSAPHGVVVRPDGNRVYVAGRDSDRVYAIDPATGAVAGSVAVGALPWGLAITPDGARLYVGQEGVNHVTVINTATETVSGTLSAGNVPWTVALSPNGSRLYVANWSDATVSVFDIPAGTPVATVRVGPDGSAPAGLSVSPDGRRVYVPNLQGFQVAQIDAVTNTTLAPIPLNAPIWTAVRPDGTRLYVTNYGQNLVSVLNTATNAVLARPRVGSFPIGVQVGQRLGLVPTMTRLRYSCDRRRHGRVPAVLIAVVRPLSGIESPAGTVIFTADGTVLGTAPVDAWGRAELPVTGLSAGTHTFAAAFVGSDRFAASDSPVLVRQVGPDGRCPRRAFPPGCPAADAAARGPREHGDRARAAATAKAGYDDGVLLAVRDVQVRAGVFGDGARGGGRRGDRDLRAHRPGRPARR
ncbi:beta-propeller fold lactonase family protein [Sphaerisporangium rufum]|uniref:beta-propeller fold lactonase family protein n=1 Tax=Sphaerisporangium rufum TaxID=1381558 RepID=UPI00194E1EE3|nr:beta-propeller fold lactonase family protein [Sphaerisporangium rufum]